jgi:hypothetical protein
MARIPDADPTEHLDALGELVDQLDLLLVVLVEEEMELVEGRAGDVPVGLLVERGEDHRVGQDLVQELTALRPCFGRQGDRQLAEGPEALDLRRILAEFGLRRDLGPRAVGVRARAAGRGGGHEGPPSHVAARRPVDIRGAARGA